MQRLIDDTRIDFFREYNLDVLFSGDRALIEAYYDIENEELHRRKASEREDKHFTEKLMSLPLTQDRLRLRLWLPCLGLALSPQRPVKGPLLYAQKENQRRVLSPWWWG